MMIPLQRRSSGGGRSSNKEEEEAFSGEDVVLRDEGIEQKISHRSRCLPPRRVCWVFAMLMLMVYSYTTSFHSAKHPMERKNISYAASSSSSETALPPILLGCKDMANLHITSMISAGHRKIVYEVNVDLGGDRDDSANNNITTTNGGGGDGQTTKKRKVTAAKAVVKRCISHRCIQYGTLVSEARYLQRLQSYYGRNQTIRYYGGCYTKAPKKQQYGNDTQYLFKIARNFTAGGPASLIERGQLLITPGGGRKTKTIAYMKFRKCLARHYTDADLEDFRTIARQYAGYPDYPLLMANPSRKYNSHIYAEQYVLVDAGIRHSDLDDIFPYRNHTYEEALEINCDTVRKVTFRPDLNCTLEHSLANPPENTNLHIDVRQAESECHKVVGITNS